MNERMNLNEARAIGYEKLKISKQLFDKALDVVKKLDNVRAEDVPPMTLIVAILGATEALTKSLGKDASEDDVVRLQKEMSDAIQLMTMAEREWRMEQVVGRGRA